MLETVVVETGRNPTGSVVWLHGLGADGHDFEPIVPGLVSPGGRALRFIFPHAPQRPVTINMGMRMRAWYDILQMGGGAEDAAGIREAQGALEELISRQTRSGIPHHKIVLAGFSQGTMMALFVGLRRAKPLAGILGYSGRLIAADLIAFEAPLYQVLALPAATGTVEPAPAQAVVSALERAQVQLHLQQLRTQLRRAP